NLFPNNNPNKLKFKIKNIFPHDTDAYTQGLTFDKNRFFESTGRRGFSSLKEVELKSGKTIKKIDLDNKYFGEGITVFNDKIYQLTWEANLGFVYDKNSFEKIDEFKYNHEGWGITTYDNKLLISDGTETIYFIDPESYKLIKKIQVYNKNGPIKLINELENVKGKIFANIYGKEEIIIFNPETGIVESILDLNGIFNKKNYNKKFDVLNGVAYNSITNQLFVTGKLWPSIFEIEIIN
ncbi:MAG: glutamine cyclotransferase, partial [Cytophagia bacterium]|nr:glutamine cyclotransferase [Cytophagia bacterium]